MIAVCVLFVASLLCAMVTNRDLFSPAKFFLFSFFVFHIGGLFSKPSPEVWVLVSVVLMVGFLTAALEAATTPATLRGRLHSPPPTAPRLARDTRLFVWLWLASTPAILAQIYMVQNFGGLEGYINTLGLRVLEWRGLGWAKTLISTLMPISLLYFAIGLTRPRSRLWWLIYGVHFLLLMVFGLLSGSRSGLLNVFALQLFCYHYLKRRVGWTRAAMAGAALMAFALVLGVAREGLKVEDSEVKTGLADAESIFKTATFNYGIEPLQLIVDADTLQLAHGSTFVSLFTNAVPRSLWPDKPETGGVFLTKTYTGDAWDGGSNLTPTFIGEFIINFGWDAGVLLFALAYPAMLYGVVRSYRRVVPRPGQSVSAAHAARFVVYLFVMWSVVALMTGEVTNVLLNLVLTQILPLTLIRRIFLPRDGVSAAVAASAVSPAQQRAAPST